MPGISSISSKIATGFNKAALDNPIMNKMYKAAKENPAKFAGKMALVSALTKDAFGCYYYVTQSLNNEKIPEEKRGFVAALDLMNGILNVILQFTVGSIIAKETPKIFNKIMDNKINPNKTREIAQKITETIKKAKPSEKISFEQVNEFLRTSKALGTAGKTAKWLGIGFTAASTLVATQIVTKRMVVPFLSTPLAGWFNEKFMGKKKAPEQMTPAMIDSTMPKIAEEKNAFSKVASK